jgi:aminoglycoside phosphotransferase (APT) family kinase protein
MSVAIEDTQGSAHDRRDFSAEVARSVAEKACVQAGLDTGGIQLVRLGENAVFTLHDRRIVVRVARTAAYLPQILKVLEVARWLTAVGFPAVRLVSGLPQALVIDGRVATFWMELSQQYATVAELGAMLRGLHALEPPQTLALPPLNPLGRTRRRIEAAALNVRDREFLTGRVAELSQRWSEVDFRLPQGPIHGDASVGNIIRAPDGSPVLIDLDGFSTGPREWDLVLTALYYERFGWHTAKEYRQFADAYGFDVTAWPGYRLLRAVREVIMVGWLSQNVAVNPAAAREVRRRIDDLREGREGRLEWNPF